MNTFLLNALRSKPDIYNAVLPYNLNWQIQLEPEVKAYLSSHPITVADIGARGGIPEELASMESYINYYAFDADRDECQRLNGIPHPQREFRVFNYFVGDANGRITFNLFNTRGQSSIFKPDERFKKLYGGSSFAVESEIEVETKTLDYIFSKEGLKAPDFLKLDTQGSELPILQAATDILKKVTLVEVEVEFTQLYAGQPLFHHVMEFMLDNGFELLYLNRVFAQRNSYSGMARGQLIFGDALFGRREDALGDLESSRLVTYVLLLINYGHLDLAYALTRQYPIILESLPTISSYFRPPQPRSLWRKITKKVNKRLLPPSRLDKLICTLLHTRKTNSLTYDSDRSWPVR